MPISSFFDNSFYYGNPAKTSIVGILVNNRPFPTIPSSVTRIENDAFYNLRNLTGTVTIPSSVTSIGEYAFFNCNSLTGTLIIPPSVTSIGYSAFSNCSSLSNIIYYVTTNINGSVFPGAPRTVLPWFVIVSNVITGFKPDKITGVNLSLPTIPSTVTSIASNAFLNRNDLTGTLTIPVSVISIGASAFSGCNGLTDNLEIPVSVTTIGNNAFSGCNKLTKISYFGTTIIGTDAFKGCIRPITILSWFDINNSNVITGVKPVKNTSKTIPFPEIPSFITRIVDNAFKDRNDLTGIVTIPSNVTNIDTSAFSGCNKLTKITYFATTTIGIDAFKDCKTPIVLPWFVINNNQITSFLPAKREKVNLLLPTIPSNVTSIASNAFLNRDDITGTLIIPSNVTSIGESAFSGCNKLTKISYFASTSIGTDAFKDCKPPTVTPWFVINSNQITGFKPDKITGVNLSLPTIPSNVTSIANNAFKDRNDLTGTVTIPITLTNIGNTAFSGCIKLTKISYFGTTSIGTDAFKDCINPTVSSLFVINNNQITGFKPDKTTGVNLSLPKIPSNVTSIGISAFLYRDDIVGTLTIPSSVTSIDNNAFNECSGLTGTLTIPSSVTSIGENTFFKCNKLRSLTFANNSKLININHGAFFNCNGLTGTLTIPSSVTGIGNNAFSGCNNLRSLTFANNSKLININSSAFFNCNDLTGTLTIPSSVTGIGNSAFSGCNKLTKISYFASTNIGTDAFKDCISPTVLPWFVIIGNQITGFKPDKRTGVNLSLPTIPSTVTSIASNAFLNRNDLTGTLTIPVSVISIGASAFSGCNGFSKISYYKDTTVSIDAFKDCKTPTIIIPKKMIIVDKFKIGFYRGKLII